MTRVNDASLLDHHRARRHVFSTATNIRTGENRLIDDNEVARDAAAFLRHDRANAHGNRRTGEQAHGFPRTDNSCSGTSGRDLQY